MRGLNSTRSSLSTHPTRHPSPANLFHSLGLQRYSSPSVEPASAGSLPSLAGGVLLPPFLGPHRPQLRGSPSVTGGSSASISPRATTIYPRLSLHRPSTTARSAVTASSGYPPPRIAASVGPLRAPAAVRELIGRVGRGPGGATRAEPVNPASNVGTSGLAVRPTRRTPFALRSRPRPSQQTLPTQRPSSRNLYADLCEAVKPRTQPELVAEPSLVVSNPPPSPVEIPTTELLPEPRPAVVARDSRPPAVIEVERPSPPAELVQLADVASARSPDPSIRLDLAEQTVQPRPPPSRAFAPLPPPSWLDAPNVPPPSIPTPPPTPAAFLDDNRLRRSMTVDEVVSPPIASYIGEVQDRRAAPRFIRTATPKTVRERGLFQSHNGLVARSQPTFLFRAENLVRRTPLPPPTIRQDDSRLFSPPTDIQQAPPLPSSVRIAALWESMQRRMASEERVREEVDRTGFRGVRRRTFPAIASSEAPMPFQPLYASTSSASRPPLPGFLARKDKAEDSRVDRARTIPRPPWLGPRRAPPPRTSPDYSQALNAFASQDPYPAPPPLPSPSPSLPPQPPSPTPSPLRASPALRAQSPLPPPKPTRQQPPKAIRPAPAFLAAHRQAPANHSDKVQRVEAAWNARRAKERDSVQSRPAELPVRAARTISMVVPPPPPAHSRPSSRPAFLERPTAPPRPPPSPPSPPKTQRREVKTLARPDMKDHWIQIHHLPSGLRQQQLLRTLVRIPELAQVGPTDLVKFPGNSTAFVRAVVREAGERAIEAWLETEKRDAFLWGGQDGVPTVTVSELECAPPASLIELAYKQMALVS